jgi:putative ABC transport system ATP-binding protein
MALVELIGVGKTYRGPERLGLPALFGRSGNGNGGDDVLKVEAVKDVTLSFEEGEFAAIAGPSGSGKSTLLNLIGTLDAPTAGEVKVLGRTTRGLSEDELAELRLRGMGFVFQSYNLIPVLTALENVEYVLRLQGVASPERERRSREALAMVGLAELADRRPDHLSGGQQQRVAVARSIVHRPRLVLADEPTANLDHKTALSLIETMASLNRDAGLTFIFSSHDPEILSRARRVVQMRDGALLGEGAAS